MLFLDEFDQTWNFNFIYYNNKFFGGTRNEYRLTGVTGYVRSATLEEGDTIILTKTLGYDMKISHEKKKDSNSSENEVLKLNLNSGWKVVSL